MLKRFVAVCALLISSFATQAVAFDWSSVRSGGSAYVSSYSSIGVYMYAAGGETLELLQFAGGTELFCGVSSLDSPTDILASSYSGWLSFTAARNNLYIAVCIKSGGYSDDVIIGIFEPRFFRGAERRARSNPPLSEERRAELEEKLREAALKYAGQG